MAVGIWSGHSLLVFAHTFTLIPVHCLLAYCFYYISTTLNHLHSRINKQKSGWYFRSLNSEAIHGGKSEGTQQKESSQST